MRIDELIRIQKKEGNIEVTRTHSLSGEAYETTVEHLMVNKSGGNGVNFV